MQALPAPQRFGKRTLCVLGLSGMVGPELLNEILTIVCYLIIRQMLLSDFCEGCGD